MRHINRLVGMFAPVLLVGLAASGCVEQETSLKIRGVVAPGGSSSTEEVTCPPDADMGTPVAKPTYTCSGEVSPGGASEFYSNLTIDVSAFERSEDSLGGQLGGDNGLTVSDKRFCSLGENPSNDNYSGAASRYTNLKFRYSSFVATFDVVNQLQDSTEVGSQGQGGGSGGFEGLKQDQNDVETRALKIRFPNVDASDLERDVKFTMIADSGGGAVAPSLELFNQSDLDALRDLHSRVVQRRTGASSYDETAKKTVVTVTAEMWIEGETFGGTSVESNRLTYPIRICGQGCGVTPRCAFESGGG